MSRAKETSDGSNHGELLKFDTLCHRGRECDSRRSSLDLWSSIAAYGFFCVLCQTVARRFPE